MNIHEYQAKALLREFGVPVPRGHAAFSVEEAVKAATELGNAGAGGEGADPCRRARQGRRRQAGEVGRRRGARGRAPARLGAGHPPDRTARQEVNRLYVEEGSTIDRELYLAALVDRESSRVAFVVSTEGGMDIEEVARANPEKILTFAVDPATGIMPHHGRRVAQALGLDRRSRQAGGEPGDQALCGVRRQGHEPAGDQSAHRHHEAIS